MRCGIKIYSAQALNQGGAFAPPTFSKHCIAILTSVETFKELKMNFYIFIIFRNLIGIFLCLAR